jgi:hypothetical protein
MINSIDKHLDSDLVKFNGVYELPEGLPLEASNAIRDDIISKKATTANLYGNRCDGLERYQIGTRMEEDEEILGRELAEYILKFWHESVKNSENRCIRMKQMVKIAANKLNFG